MRKRLKLLVRAMIVGLGAVALLAAPAPAAAAPMGCTLCGSSCFTLSLGCIQMCHTSMSTCDYTGSCQGQSGTWYPAEAVCADAS
jgi:hypothetical protein